MTTLILAGGEGTVGQRIHAVDWSDVSDDFDTPGDWDVWSQLNAELV